MGRGLRAPSRLQFREDIVLEEYNPLIQRFVEEAFDPITRISSGGGSGHSRAGSHRESYGSSGDTSESRRELNDN